MISNGNLYLGNHLDYFGTKFRSMDAKVLSRLFRAKIIQSTTATTSIVFFACGNAFCHCEIPRESVESWQSKLNTKERK